MKLKKHFWTFYMIIAVAFVALCFNATGQIGGGSGIHGTSLTSLGLDSNLADLTTAEVQQLENIGAITLSLAQWTGLGGATTAGMALWDDADNSAQRTTLGLIIGTDIQALVTEGSLADSVIVSADIKDDTIAAADLAHVISSVNQAVSVDDAGTLTPTAGYARVFIALTALSDPSAMTLSETGAVDNVVIYIVSVATNTVTFADTAGVQELKAPATVEQYESIVFRYEVDRWVEIGRATNALGFSTITTAETEYLPISYMIDGASAPDALATITSGTDKADCRTFAGDADEDVLFTWQVPLDCDVTSGIKFRVICFITNATGPSTETWQFELHGFSLGDGDALDGTLGTAQTSNSGSRTDVQYDRVATAWSSAMTSTHITNLTKGETVTFKLYRDIDDNDTYVQVVGVAGLEFKYKRTHDTTF